jgi:hypothetical protein
MNSPNPLLYQTKIGLAPPARLPKHHEPCWCGSGLKFKKCHRDREAQAKANFFAETAKMRSDGNRGKCLHPAGGGGACSSKSIASHTVQKGGGLFAIAEDGHVLTTYVDFSDIHRAQGNPEPRRIGVRDASTFPGFCNTHDTALFKIIEQPSLAINAEAAFLFLFRAVCLELVRKRAAIASLPSMKRMDRGMPPAQQFNAQSRLRAYEQGLMLSDEAVITRKSELDDMLLAKDWSNVRYCQVEFNSLLPLTTACAFYPEFDWTGTRLQDIANLSVTLKDLGFTVTSYGSRSSVIFVWTGPLAGVQKRFVDSFLAVPDAEKAERIAAFCFETSENTQLTPTWWRALPEVTRKKLADKMWNGTTRRPHSPGAMADTAPLPAPVGVASVRSSWE